MKHPNDAPMESIWVTLGMLLWSIVTWLFPWKLIGEVLVILALIVLLIIYAVPWIVRSFPVTIP